MISNGKSLRIQKTELEYGAEWPILGLNNSTSQPRVIKGRKAMTMKRKLMTGLLGTGTALALAMPVAAQDTSIATVVKIAGIQWFNRMEEG
jgi:hypothetical protein